jgi:hypothetical protein
MNTNRMYETLFPSIELKEKLLRILYDNSVSSRKSEGMAGRGRGRGLTLPAWMTTTPSPENTNVRHRPSL